MAALTEADGSAATMEEETTWPASPAEPREEGDDDEDRLVAAGGRGSLAAMDQEELHCVAEAEGELRLELVRFDGIDSEASLVSPSTSIATRAPRLRHCRMQPAPCALRSAPCGVAPSLSGRASLPSSSQATQVLLKELFHTQLPKMVPEYFVKNREAARLEHTRAEQPPHPICLPMASSLALTGSLSDGPRGFVSHRCSLRPQAHRTRVHLQGLSVRRATLSAASRARRHRRRWRRHGRRRRHLDVLCGAHLLRSRHATAGAGPRHADDESLQG